MIRVFLQHTVPAVVRPLQILWNQIIGFVFLCFAVIGAMRAYPDVRAFDGDMESLGKVALPAVWVLVMGTFAILSFWKARRVARAPRTVAK